MRALLEGARIVSREGNRVAAIALLWSAVALSPTDLVAHRRLAAALANAGDRQAAADEYARFVEFALKAHDVERAQLELAYGLALLGPQPALVGAASRVKPALAMPPLRTLEPPAVRRVSMVEPLRRLAVVSATLLAAITVLFYASSLILLIN
ncbi:MAG TPA: hypothetical protein VMJ92_02540 [Candidatus Limnocylindrales bacterium]|nr:hypothetical protein [Candidatus Limnocylindrales bacterium]